MSVVVEIMVVFGLLLSMLGRVSQQPGLQVTTYGFISKTGSAGTRRQLDDASNKISKLIWDDCGNEKQKNARRYYSSSWRCSSERRCGCFSKSHQHWRPVFINACADLPIAVQSRRNISGREKLNRDEEQRCYAQRPVMNQDTDSYTDKSAKRYEEPECRILRA